VPGHCPARGPGIIRLQCHNDRQVFSRLFQQSLPQGRSHDLPCGVADGAKQQLQAIEFIHQQGVPAGIGDQVMQAIVEQSRLVDELPAA